MRLQFQAQTTSYRAQFPAAQFDIIELDGRPIGRIIVDRNNARLLIVDQAIVPELRNRGIGTALMRSVTRPRRPRQSCPSAFTSRRIMTRRCGCICDLVSCPL